MFDLIILGGGGRVKGLINKRISILGDGNIRVIDQGKVELLGGLK